MAKDSVRIGIAPDSFKGSLSALEAATCIERGLKNVLSNVVVVKVPMADGGEGTVQAMVEATSGRVVTRSVCGPRGWKVKASFGVTGDGKTAIIEMASASGVALLRPTERNPMLTSTFGTGELIRHALAGKAEKVLVGIGGSATNDGGTGMAKALGVKFLDARGKDLPGCGESLKAIEKIDIRNMDPRVACTSFEAACDVDNPLTGPRGAARVYGPQKGATPDMVKELDAGLRHLARVIKRDLKADIEAVPGSGAAGGLGAGLMAFLGARLRPGIDIVVDAVKLEQKLKGCSLVITGEGRMDGQTVFGKTPFGVAKVARKLGIPVIAISGSVGADVDMVRSIGIKAYFSALQEPVPEDDLPVRGPDMLVNCAEQIARLMALDFKNRRALRLRRGRA